MFFFFVSDQVGHKSGCSATEDGQPDLKFWRHIMRDYFMGHVNKSASLIVVQCSRFAKKQQQKKKKNVFPHDAVPIICLLK